jgi:hypothetical protein
MWHWSVQTAVQSCQAEGHIFFCCCNILPTGLIAPLWRTAGNTTLVAIMTTDAWTKLQEISTNFWHGTHWLRYRTQDEPHNLLSCTNANISTHRVQETHRKVAHTSVVQAKMYPTKIWYLWFRESRYILLKWPKIFNCVVQNIFPWLL